MNDYESIYINHYPGETYRFGVAYLRSESPPGQDEATDDLPSLAEQRAIIGRLALEAEAIVIAEFIDHCGPIKSAERPGWNELLTFYRETHPQVVFAACQYALGFDTPDTFRALDDLQSDALEVIETEW